MSSELFFLIEDGKIKSSFDNADDAMLAMKTEHKKDVFSILARRRILSMFLRGKYKLKEYSVVKALTVHTISSDDVTLGGLF